MQPARSAGPSSCQAAGKTYVVDVPVYAAPEGTKQEDWNKLSHKFTITSPDGTAKTYEVSQNMANPATADAKIYPATGVADADKNTYFPVNTWGFGITPRNLKQYNYQMLLDSLVWNNYSVRGVAIKFTPLMGAMQPGQFEAVLLNNAQIMPSAPFTNQTNSCSFSATEQNAFAFNINNETVAVKNMKSVQDTFDSVADFGIIWFRTAGFSNLTAITEVAKLQIKVSVALSNYSPSPYAQLIGPWIEAGYPIDSDGTVVQTKTADSITGTEILDVDTGADVIDIARISRGRAQKPRWYMVPTVRDTKICNLHGSGGVAHAKRIHKNFLSKIGQNADTAKFPELVQDKFDGAVSGKEFLNDAKAGDDAHVVAKPAFPEVFDPGLYIDTADPVIYEATPSGTNPRFQLAYYPDQSALNSIALAQGGVGVAFEGKTENLGKRVGVTFKFVTSFAPGTVPLEGEFKEAFYQPSSGYTAGVGAAAAAEAPNDANAELGSFLSKVCAFGIAGLKGISGVSGQAKQVQDWASVTAKAANTWTNFKNKAKTAWKSLRTDADLQVQAAAVEVPENAAFCSIGAFPEGSAASIYAKGFLACLPQAAKYGLQKLDADKMTNDKARLTISGQVNTLHQAIVAVQGAALPEGVSQLPYAVDVQESLVLVASKVNPAEDPAGFYNSAIPITSILDSISQTSASGSMYVNAVPEGSAGGRFVFTKTTEQAGRIRADNTNVAGFGYVPVVSSNPCNFTVAFPDYLYDAGTQGLVKVNAGDKIFFSIVKSSAITYSHVINETLGTYNFFVLPNLAEGTDKTSADQALHQYILTQDEAAPLKVTSITQGDALTETVYMAEDGERRFTFECTTPAGEAAVAKKAIKVTSS